MAVRTRIFSESTCSFARFRHYASILPTLVHPRCLNYLAQRLLTDDARIGTIRMFRTANASLRPRNAQHAVRRNAPVTGTVAHAIEEVQ